MMVGVRVLVGSQDTTRVPSSLEIFGRTVNMTVVRPRWVEFCFTREESIQCTAQAQNKISINFGASQDPGDVNMIDSVQIWCKTKEAFGWSDDTDMDGGVSSSMAQSETDESRSTTASLTAVDKVIVTILECLEAALVVVENSKLRPEDSSSALDVGTRLLVAAGPPQTQRAARSVVSALHQSRTSCHAHTDSALLKHATQILNTPEHLGVEQFHHLVATARNIAVARPGNLVRFAETQQSKVASKQSSRSRSEECQKFIELLSSAFWGLVGEIPENSASPNLGQGGLTHIEVTVQSLIEIIHAFTLIDIDLVGFACEQYLKFLLCPDPKVSFPARAALVKAVRPRPRRRRLLPPTPPGAQARQPTPRGTPEARPAAPAPPQRLSPVQNNQARRQQELHEARDALLGPGGVQLGGVAGNLEALLPMGGRGGNLPAMLDLPQDMDDELAIAIALSLQDQGDGGVLQQGLQDLHQGLQGLQQLANLGQGLAGILGGRGDQDDSDAEDAVEVEEAAAVVDEAGHYSDTTASAPGSDDEEGSVSGQAGEAEGAESEGAAAGSDSGGSAENLPVSGRSSAYDVGVVETVETVKKEEVEADQLDTDTEVRLSGIRQILLERLVGQLGQLREVGGARCIPFMQLALALAADLDLSDGRDKAALGSLLTALVEELGVGGGEARDNNLAQMATRSEYREFQLVILRLLSVLMSRTRAPTAKQPAGAESSSNLVSRTTAAILADSGLVGHHLLMLKSIVTYWQGAAPLEEGVVLPGCKLLRPAASHPPPDMAPFFLKQYVKSHAYDVFEAYPQLLTEMALRIPYQLKKNADMASDAQPHFDQAWFNELCELMITPQAPFVKRQVRKLLLLICGSKDQYRQLRDLHTLETRIREIKIIVGKGGFDFTDFEGGSVNLLYDTLIQLIEQLKSCVEVAESRTLNWQRFCMSDDTVLTFLLAVSYMVDNGKV